MKKRAKIYLDFKRVLFFITLYIRRQQFSVIFTPKTCQRLKLSRTAIIHNTKGLQITYGNKFDLDLRIHEIHSKTTIFAGEKKVKKCVWASEHVQVSYVGPIIIEPFLNTADLLIWMPFVEVQFDTVVLLCEQWASTSSKPSLNCSLSVRSHISTWRLISKSFLTRTAIVSLIPAMLAWYDMIEATKVHTLVQIPVGWHCIIEQLSYTTN